MLWFFPKFEENFRIKRAYLRKWKEWSWSSRSSRPSPNRLHEMTSVLVPHCSKAPDSSWNLLWPTVTPHKFHNIFDESGRGKKENFSGYTIPAAPLILKKNFPLDLFICTIFTRGQFWPSGIVIACVCVSVRVSVCVYQSLACPHDNSSAVYARITKCGWETQNTLVKMPIIFRGDWPWPSRSN